MFVSCFTFSNLRKVRFFAVVLQRFDWTMTLDHSMYLSGISRTSGIYGFIETSVAGDICCIVTATSDKDALAIRSAAVFLGIQTHFEFHDVTILEPKFQVFPCRKSIHKQSCWSRITLHIPATSSAFFSGRVAAASKGDYLLCGVVCLRRALLNPCRIQIKLVQRFLRFVFATIRETLIHNVNNCVMECASQLSFIDRGSCAPVCEFVRQFQCFG